MDEFFARNRLSAYLDGELSEAEAAEVAQAIEQQPELRAAYEELRTTVAFLRRHGPVQAPARLHAGVMRAIEDQPAGRAWQRRLLAVFGRSPLQGLGVAIVVGAVLLVVFRGPSAPPPAAPPEREAAAPGIEAPGDIPPEPAEEAPPEATAEGAAGAGPEIAAKIDLSRKERGSGRSARAGDGADGLPIEKLLAKQKGATYVPQWDEEPAAGAGEAGAPVGQAASDISDESGSGSAFAYRLSPSSADALRVLVALAEKLGGGAYEADGSRLQPRELTIERNHARVLLRIPASQLENLEPYLRTLGGLVPMRADQDRLYNADAVQVTVEVLYMP